MYKTVLVNADIEDGRRFLESLEGSLQIIAAFWFHFEDEEQWKLVVVSPDVSDKGPRQLYTMVSMLLSNLANHPERPLEFPLDRVKLVSPTSLLYKMVKQRTGPKDGPVREGS